VRFDQAGHDAAVADVENLGVGPDERFDVGPAADRRYSTACDGQRFGGGLRFVDRQHGSVDDKLSGWHYAIFVDGFADERKLF
jgi:hypothetical protein